MSARTLLVCLVPLLLACPPVIDDDDSVAAEVELVLHATIEPDPPVVGRNELHIELLDSDGHGVEGADLTVVPWMGVHGHGSTEEPVIEELGDGLYDAAPITFTMPGPWEVDVGAAAPGWWVISRTLEYEVGWE